MSIKAAQTLSTSEKIAEQLRNSIILGEYRDGQALKQDQLAAHFQVSKIPLREALTQLKTEGLVATHINRGSVVSSLSIGEVEEIYTMRIALEEIALKRSIANLKPEHTIAAESALKLIEVSENPLDWTRLNWEFHASLYRAASMPTLLETVCRLHNNVARYLLLYLNEMNYQEVSQAEHWQLLEACSAGKSRQATTILRRHLKDALNQTLRYMKTRN